MRYPPEQVDRLAAEYVLGTLHGAARRRMDTLIRDRTDVRLAVWRWERNLNELNGSLAPVSPPESVWQGIERRTAGTVAARRESAVKSWWPRLALVTAVAAIFAFWLGAQIPQARPDQVAMFTDDAAQPLWVISADSEGGRLISESGGVPAAPDDRVYELWALPQGEPPRSLGLLETEPGRYERELSSVLVAAVGNSAGLAVSLEPPGGSPTGLPTGPIVYQATLLRL